MNAGTRNFVRRGVCWGALLLSIPLFGGIELGSPFTDGMVLQRDREIPVWGWAEPAARVVVTFSGSSVSGVAGEDGRWRVTLPPEKASAEGRTLTVREEGKGAETRVRDVLVGEVWFCSGQSNCELPIWGPRCRFRDRNGYMLAQMTDLPLVRYAYCSDYRCSERPRERTSRPVEWRRFNRQNLLCCDEERKWGFSAMGVYFALELHRRLGIPVGVVGAYWGGSPIAAWIPGVGQMFNEMVSPWCPYAMRGVIWYQGCSDVRHHETYCESMHRFYDGWSRSFEAPDLSLRFVQIAPYGGYASRNGVNDLVGLQGAQAKFAAEEPHAGMVVINDAGNLHDIHPNDKEVVGRRLAALALARDYGQDVEGESPAVRSCRVEGPSVRIFFDHVREWTFYTWDQSVPTLFEIAGEDGVFHPAQIANLIWHRNAGHPGYIDGEVEGVDLVVSAAGVRSPRAIRYLYRSPYAGYLVNEANLPLGVFHVEF